MFTHKSFENNKELKHLPRVAKKARRKHPTQQLSLVYQLAEVAGGGEKQQIYFSRTSKVLQERLKYSQSCF